MARSRTEDIEKDYRLGIREARGVMTQDELAERTGFTRPTITKLETVPTDPRFSTMIRLARGAEASLDRIARLVPKPDVATEIAMLTQRISGVETALQSVVALAQGTNSSVNALQAAVKDIVVDVHAAIRTAEVFTGQRRPKALESE